MTHEELGKYLGLIMVVKRLVRLLPPAEIEAMEKACRDVVAQAQKKDDPDEASRDLALIEPHIVSTLTDIFSVPEKSS